MMDQRGEEGECEKPFREHGSVNENEQREVKVPQLSELGFMGCMGLLGWG